MKRALVFATWLVFFVSAAFTLPVSARAQCRFACVAHKVTDLKALTLELQAELGEAEERNNRQDVLISALRERSTSLEATGASLTAVSRSFNALLGCMGEIPLTRYGQPEGPSGYLFQISTSEEFKVFPTTALDISYDNSPVGAWVFVDACNQSRVTPRSSLVPRGLEPTAHSDGLATPGSAFR